MKKQYAIAIETGPNEGGIQSLVQSFDTKIEAEQWIENKLKEEPRSIFTELISELFIIEKYIRE